MVNQNKQCMFCKHHIKIKLSTGRDGGDYCWQDVCDCDRTRFDEEVEKALPFLVSPFRYLDGYIYKKGECPEYEKRPPKVIIECKNCKYFDTQWTYVDSDVHLCTKHKIGKRENEFCSDGEMK